MGTQKCKNMKIENFAVTVFLENTAVWIVTMMILGYDDIRSSGSGSFLNTANIIVCLQVNLQRFDELIGNRSVLSLESI